MSYYFKSWGKILIKLEKKWLILKDINIVSVHAYLDMKHNFHIA